MNLFLSSRLNVWRCQCRKDTQKVIFENYYLRVVDLIVLVCYSRCCSVWKRFVLHLKESAHQESLIFFTHTISWEMAIYAPRRAVNNRKEHFWALFSCSLPHPILFLVFPCESSSHERWIEKFLIVCYVVTTNRLKIENFSIDISSAKRIQFVCFALFTF